MWRRLAETGARPDAFVVGDGRAMPFADESFDHATSISVLEHVAGEGRRRGGARRARPVRSTRRPGGDHASVSPRRRASSTGKAPAYVDHGERDDQGRAFFQRWYDDAAVTRLVDGRPGARARRVVRRADAAQPERRVHPHLPAARSARPGLRRCLRASAVAPGGDVIRLLFAPPLRRRSPQAANPRYTVADDQRCDQAGRGGVRPHDTREAPAARGDGSRPPRGALRGRGGLARLRARLRGPRLPLHEQPARPRCRVAPVRRGGAPLPPGARCRDGDDRRDRTVQGWQHAHLGCGDDGGIDPVVVRPPRGSAARSPRCRPRRRARSTRSGAYGWTTASTSSSATRGRSTFLPGRSTCCSSTATTPTRAPRRMSSAGGRTYEQAGTCSSTMRSTRAATATCIRVSSAASAEVARATARSSRRAPGAGTIAHFVRRDRDRLRPRRSRGRRPRAPEPTRPR